MLVLHFQVYISGVVDALLFFGYLLVLPDVSFVIGGVAKPVNLLVESLIDFLLVLDHPQLLELVPQLEEQPAC